MKRALFAGEINVDLVLQGYTEFPVPGKEVLVQDFAMVLGSATAIMAMGLARLGTPVAFVGRVGDDVWGRYCLEDMAGRGIDLSRVIRGGGLKTGVTVSITHPADRALVTYLGAISALTGADVKDEAMAGLDHLHASSFFFQEGLRPDFPDLFARARRAGLTTSLDTGFDPSERWDGGLRETLRRDRPLLSERGRAAGAQRLRRSRARESARSRTGARASWPSSAGHGAMALDGGQLVHVPAYPVETRGHDRRRRLLQRRLPAPLAAGRARRRVPAARRRLRRAQHAGPRRHGGAAHARRRPRPSCTRGDDERAAPRRVSGREGARSMGGKYRWWIGGLLFLSTVINYLDRQTLSVLGPTLKTEFSWSNQDFALIIIAFRIAYAVMQTVSGRVLDRIGTRNGLTLSVLWYSSVAVLTSLRRGAARASAASASCSARARPPTGRGPRRPCPSGSRAASGAGRWRSSTAGRRWARRWPRRSCSSSPRTSAAGAPRSW